jgi:hypothetical protein
MSLRPIRVAAYVAVWLVLATPLSLWLFLHSSTTTVIASHDAVLRPTLDRHITLHTGPFLPDVRDTSPGRVGVDVTLGKTEARSTDELVQRYAFIASQPEGQVVKVEGALRWLAYDAAVRGGALALVPVAAWALLGPRRRRTIARRARSWQGAAVGAGVMVLAVLVWQPWDAPDRTMRDDATWLALDDYLAGVSLPAEVQRLEISTDVTTDETRRLIESAIDTYHQSKTFYADAARAAAELDLREPLKGDTVALLVSDRHDNIGMDPVARAIGQAGGATVVLDAGDDTSTGEPWEAFSLDSLVEEFDGLDRYAVAGNHDHGSFVSDYLQDRGWTTLDGEVVDGPGGSHIVGVNDPRSSGLGNWRDESGLSFDEQAERIADDACASADRINTLLVHDADSGAQALARGCVDLVLAGHLHLQLGPTKVLGANGHAGYTYTNGTTGGAAYAIAVGSKLRRAAEVTLVTYRDGRPVGLQPVVLETDGRFDVGAYLPLDPS